MKVVLDDDGVLPGALGLDGFHVVRNRMAKRCHLTRAYPNEGETLCGMVPDDMWSHLPTIPGKEVELCAPCLRVAR